MIFNEQITKAGSSIISFGITSGTLSLEFENCSTSYLDCEVQLRTSLPTEKETKYQVDASINSFFSTGNPSWLFQHPTDENTHLQTCLVKEKWLKVLCIETKPCFITSTFKISRNDISIIKAHGILPNQVVPLQESIVKKLEPCKNEDGLYYLYQVKYQYG